MVTEGKREGMTLKARLCEYTLPYSSSFGNKVFVFLNALTYFQLKFLLQ